MLIKGSLEDRRFLAPDTSENATGGSAIAANEVLPDVNSADPGEDSFAAYGWGTDEMADEAGENEETKEVIADEREEDEETGEENADEREEDEETGEENEEVEEESEEEPESKKSEDDEESKGWPESAQKRVDKLTAQKGEVERERDALLAEKEQLRGQVAELTANVNGHRPQVVMDDPLGWVESEDELNRTLAEAERQHEWAAEHFDEGGEIEVDGKKLELTPSQARVAFTRTQAVLTKFGPRRRAFLEDKNRTESAMRQVYPDYLDKTKPEGQQILAYEAMFPAIKQLPKYKLILMDLIRGERMRMEELKSAEAKTEEKKAIKPPPEIAPRVPNRPRGEKPKPAVQKQEKRRQPPKGRASMTVDDLAAAM